MIEAVSAKQASIPVRVFTIPGEPPVGNCLGIPGGRTAREQILSFAMRDGVALSPLLIESPMPAIAALAYRLQDVPRKVSGEPYFKHVLRTVILASRAAASIGLSLDDQRVLTLAAYLHDSLELQRLKLKTGYNEEHLVADLLKQGVKEDLSHRAAALVSAMTPSREGKSLQGDYTYLKYKVINFEQKFTHPHPDRHLLRILKTADLAANMEETIDDIELGREDGLMGRPFRVRMEIFKACIGVIELRDPENPLLPLIRGEMGRWQETHRIGL